MHLCYFYYSYHSWFQYSFVVRRWGGSYGCSWPRPFADHLALNLQVGKLDGTVCLVSVDVFWQRKNLNVITQKLLLVLKLRTLQPIRLVPKRWSEAAGIGFADGTMLRVLWRSFWPQIDRLKVKLFGHKVHFAQKRFPFYMVVSKMFSPSPYIHLEKCFFQRVESWNQHGPLTNWWALNSSRA